MSKKNKHWTQKNWNSLNDVKKFIEENTKEKILSFNGCTLETNKAVYGISDRQLYINGICCVTE